MSEASGSLARPLRAVLPVSGVWLATSLSTTTPAEARPLDIEVGAHGGYLFGGSAEGTAAGVRREASLGGAASYGAFVDRSEA